MVNENDAKESLLEIYSNLRYKPEYNEYKHDCPERMWSDKSLSHYNCPDEDRIEEIFDKMIEDSLRDCPVVILARDIDEGVHFRRPEKLPVWIAAHNREIFKANLNITEWGEKKG